MTRVAIVGGGISGLSAAYYLSKAGCDCTLIEARPELGGLLGSERVEGCLVEKGPDSFVAQKPWAMELIRELGIADQVIGSNDRQRKVYVLREGQLIRLPAGIQFLAPTKLLPILTSPLLSWKAKWTMGRELFRRPGRKQPERSVAQFVSDHYGDEVKEYLAQPMLAGVYGGAPERLSIDSVLPRFVQLEQKYGSLTRGLLHHPSAAIEGREPTSTRDQPASLFLSLQGGMQQLVDTLADRLEGKIRRVRATVRSIEGNEDSFRLALDGEPLTADQVVIATPAYTAADLLRAIDSRLAAALEAIPYHSSTTIALLYPRPEFEHPLDGFGLLVPRSENRPITACTWVNTKFAHRAPPDRALLRAFLGAEHAETYFQEPEEDLADLAHHELSRLMGYRQKPVAWRIHRWARSMPQYEIGHGKRAAEIEARLEGLGGIYLTGNAYQGIGIPDCIRLSKAVAEALTRRAKTLTASP